MVPHQQLLVHKFGNGFPLLLASVEVPVWSLDELYATICKQESQHLEAISIIARDLNRCSLWNVLPKYHQHVSCPTRGNRTLGNCYTTVKGAYKSIPQSHFSKLDHSSVLLLPIYKQKLKHAQPVLRTVPMLDPGTRIQAVWIQQNGLSSGIFPGIWTSMWTR